MNLHIKTGLGIKNYVLDPNSNVEYEFFLTDFSWQIWAKNTKLNFSSESVKTKEHNESNSCKKYYFSTYAFYKINLGPILKKLLQNVDFHHFPLFEIFAHLTFTSDGPFNLCGGPFDFGKMWKFPNVRKSLKNYEAKCDVWMGI